MTCWNHRITSKDQSNFISFNWRKIDGFAMSCEGETGHPSPNLRYAETPRPANCSHTPTLHNSPSPFRPEGRKSSMRSPPQPEASRARSSCRKPVETGSSSSARPPCHPVLHLTPICHRLANRHRRLPALDLASGHVSRVDRRE